MVSPTNLQAPLRISHPKVRDSPSESPSPRSMGLDAGDRILISKIGFEGQRPRSSMALPRITSMLDQPPPTDLLRGSAPGVLPKEIRADEHNPHSYGKEGLVPSISREKMWWGVKKMLESRVASGHSSVTSLPPKCHEQALIPFDQLRDERQEILLHPADRPT